MKATRHKQLETTGGAGGGGAVARNATHAASAVDPLPESGRKYLWD